MKTIYVLERYNTEYYYRNMLSEIDAGVSNLTPELQVQFAQSICDMREIIMNKINQCTEDGGVWEGVIGRPSIESLCSDGYAEWCCARSIPHRVVEAQILDTATTWVGYLGRSKHREYTDRILEAFNKIA